MFFAHFSSSHHPTSGWHQFLPHPMFNSTYIVYSGSYPHLPWNRDYHLSQTLTCSIPGNMITEHQHHLAKRASFQTTSFCLHIDLSVHLTLAHWNCPLTSQGLWHWNKPWSSCSQVPMWSLLSCSEMDRDSSQGWFHASCMGNVRWDLLHPDIKCLMGVLHLWPP